MNQLQPPHPTSVSVRLRAHLGLKLALAVGLNLWALLPYCLLQQHVFFPITVMTPSAIDHWIPFNDKAIWLYLSLFLFAPIAPMQMIGSDQLCRYAFGVIAMSFAADLIFFFWPTAVMRPATDGANGLYRYLTTLVNPLNAFPSLHAALATYSALCWDQVFPMVRKPWIGGNAIWLWAIAIIYATLATKEHVVLDATAGILLGLATYLLAFSQLKVLDRKVWLRLPHRRRSVRGEELSNRQSEKLETL
ncbi:MAG: phosphatase PAP2 family protein [Candidatus Binatia bacterium]